MKVADPAMAYGTSRIDTLRQKVICAVKDTTDEDMLNECLSVLSHRTNPCAFTDEEFVEEIRLSEASGFVSHDEALAEFAKWGFVR